ncbi:MAG: CinA family protein [Candidatus Dormibacteria bacterium]
MGDPALAADFPEARLAGERLAASGRTVAVAESCTGGLLGAALTSVPGSSRYVRGGVITYADDLKTSLLGVPAPLLAGAGAVSAEVAEAMAVGVRARTGADIGLAVTGVAGPGGESPAKPAGLVYVARADAHGVRGARIDGDRGREGNRAAAVRAALRLLLEDT